MANYPVMPYNPNLQPMVDPSTLIVDWGKAIGEPVGRGLARGIEFGAEVGLKLRDQKLEREREAARKAEFRQTEERRRWEFGAEVGLKRRDQKLERERETARKAEFKQTEERRGWEFDTETWMKEWDMDAQEEERRRADDATWIAEMDRREELALRAKETSMRLAESDTRIAATKASLAYTELEHEQRKKELVAKEEIATYAKDDPTGALSDLEELRGQMHHELYVLAGQNLPPDVMAAELSKVATFYHGVFSSPELRGEMSKMRQLYIDAGKGNEARQYDPDGLIHSALDQFDPLVARMGRQAIAFDSTLSSRAKEVLFPDMINAELARLGAVTWGSRKEQAEMELGITALADSSPSIREAMHNEALYRERISTARLEQNLAEVSTAHERQKLDTKSAEAALRYLEVSLTMDSTLPEDQRDFAVEQIAEARQTIKDRGEIQDVVHGIKVGEINRMAAQAIVVNKLRANAAGASTVIADEEAYPILKQMDAPNMRQTVIDAAGKRLDAIKAKLDVTPAGGVQEQLKREAKQLSKTIAVLKRKLFKGRETMRSTRTLQDMSVLVLSERGMQFETERGSMTPEELRETPGYREGYMIDRNIDIYFSGTPEAANTAREELKTAWVVLNSSTTGAAAEKRLQDATTLLNEQLKLYALLNAIEGDVRSPISDTISRINSMRSLPTNDLREQPKEVIPPASEPTVVDGTERASRTPPGPGEPKRKTERASRTPPGPGEPNRKKAGNVTVIWDERQQQWVPENTVK